MKYSISDLEQLTGVTTHTIRIWERRYNALKPMRSAGNTRFYDDSQLRKLLNIVSLSNTGLRISQVCAMSESDINAMLQQEIDLTKSGNHGYEYYISQLLSFGLAYEEQQFVELLASCVTKYGLRECYLHVIYPLLIRTGLMWRKDNICPAQEHFLSNLIRQKIYTAIDEIPFEPNPASTWLLFLPEDEDHETGLLFAYYLLKLSGQKVIYLGAKVPLDSVREVVEGVNIDEILIFMVRSRPDLEASEYLKELSASCPRQSIHIAGSGSLRSKNLSQPNMDWFTTIDDLENAIKTITHVN